MMSAIADAIARRPELSLAVVIATLVVVRVATLVLTPLNLGPDEAQYWSWSLYPSFGYFSKPPLIAWLIGASTALCGHAEYCIRLPSPLIHGATALALFMAARRLFDAQVGLWSAVAYLLLPGTSLSSLLITTDVPLLLFWSLALWALAEMQSSRAWKWVMLLGASIGLGLLSKYAMLYFVLGVSIALVASREGRSLLLDARLTMAGVIALVVLSPNLLWNLSNDLATVRHTASNAKWGAGDLFNPGHSVEFLAAQAGIIGPVAAAIFVWGLWQLWRNRRVAWPECLLLSLCMPVIAVVTLQAFISRANANWAAPAVVGICVLVCAWALRGKWRWPLRANTLVNATIALLVCALATSPAVVAFVGQENAVKRLRGWPEAGREIRAKADTAPFTAIVSDDREDMASLFYYTRERSLPLRMWPTPNPGNQYEAAHALTANVAGRVLLVTRRQDVRAITSAYERVTPLGTIETRLDPKRTRVFYLYDLHTPVATASFPEFSIDPSTD